MNLRMTPSPLLLLGYWSITIACVSAQGLTKKTIIPADAGAANAAESNLDELPIWELQFYRAIETVEKANENRALQNSVIAASDDTTLIKSEQLKQVAREHAQAISGLELRVHFRLKDVGASKKLSRNREAVNLSLDDSTFPYRMIPDAITVVCSPTEARQLQIGCIIRADGTLTTPSRLSFDKVNFVDSEKNLIRFYVNSVRVLEGKPLDEFRGFETRYHAKFPVAPSTPKKSPSTSFDP